MVATLAQRQVAEADGPEGTLTNGGCDTKLQVSSSKSDTAKLSEVAEQVRRMLTQVEQDLQKASGDKVAPPDGQKKYFVYDVRCERTANLGGGM